MAGPATRALCALVAATSMGLAVWERAGGAGPLLWSFSAAQVRQGQLWRLATYPFVCPTPMGLLLSCLGLWLLGGLHERRWGTRAFVRFVALTSVGGAVLALILQPALNLLMPFSDLGLASGPVAAFDAMLVALALHAPDSRILWGFVLPISARQAVFAALALDVVTGIMQGATDSLSVSLGGMAVGWLLCTGRWRPGRWRWRRHHVVRRPSHLYAVPTSDRRPN